VKALPTQKQQNALKTVSRKRRRTRNKTRTPRVSIPWNRYLETDRKELTAIQHWLDLVNDPPKGVPLYNFGIRGYRLVQSDKCRTIIQSIADVVANIVREPTADIDYLGHHPLMFFLSVLESVNRTRIRRCVACSKYFYANRNNKLACSEACSITARVRKHREKQSIYELNRKLKDGVRENAREMHLQNIQNRLREGR
jgi:hypothetical protein